MAEQLTFVLLLAAPLALVVSLLLLHGFAGAVKRSMRESGGEQLDDVASAAQPGDTPEHPLSFEELEATGRPSPWRRKRFAAVYLVGGIVYATIMAAVFLHTSGVEFLPIRTSVSVLIYLWPAVLAIGLTAALNWRDWAMMTAAYVLLISAVIVPVEGTQGLLGLLILSAPNVIGSVLLALFLVRRVRAVGPMTLVFVAACIAGASGLLGFIGASDERVRGLASIGVTLGANEYVSAGAVLLIGGLIASVLGWVLLRIVGALYRARLMTDHTLVADTVFLFFGLVHAIPIANNAPIWMFAGLGAFAAYKVVSIVGFALVRGKADPQAPRLLLLRVFSLGKRSERFFDAFSKLWRRHGSIRMIAGPDLATANVEPHEFLAFLHGQLSRRFIADDAGLDQQLAGEDEARRYDGRYGVAEFFCHDNAWRLALRRLVRQSEAVLMDLRGFGPEHQGCVYEIEALLELAPLRHVTFVIDRTTDETFLHQTFLEGWNKTTPGSPNRKNGAPRARLFRLSGGKRGPQALASAVAASAAH